MEDYIAALYKKYLYGIISHDEFLELRHTINNTGDSKLAVILENEWSENICQGMLDETSKKNIRATLGFYIENDKKRIRKRTIFSIVAALIPFIVLLTFFTAKQFPLQKSEKFTVAVESGNKALVTLPDQSKVWLNSNTTLDYRKGKKNTREVTLSGEAFFKVFKSEKQPFIVTMHDLQVEVLGTSFNAKSRASSHIIETSLVEGSIKIESPCLSQSYYLKPNEKAIYNKHTKQIQVMHTDNELETAWRDNKLKFSSERFIDVMAMLEEWYGVKIICKCPDIENDLLSGSFKNEKIETTLEALKVQYNIHYTRNKDTITIVSNN